MSVERFVRPGALFGLLFLSVMFWMDESRAQQAHLPLDVRMAEDVRRMRRSLRTISELPGAANSDERVANAGNLRNPASGTYDVVALRVEFQPDTSRFTTGTGRFDDDPYAGLVPALDPLPHDADYFQAHLDFLKHYVERVSDGIAEVRTHLIPDIIQVSQPMSAYAPTGPEADADAELAKLAELVGEAWQIADEAISFDMSGFDPERTAFVLFHAGIGRDIELIGTTLDKTPQDLPSLYFDERALDRLGVRNLTIDGIPVDHTMILPRTETRLGTDFIADEPFLLELSINGLLAASFFNYLGVPDLFDTETGESAIGPFGLMDPQGIFAYRGLFPPEPMAWTKYYLGWMDPVELHGAGPETSTLRAASVPGSSPSARAVISDAEYFLIENRYRDPEHDGLTMTILQEGRLIQQHVENGDPDFNSFTIDGFAGGVVVQVDNYDWALPGGLAEDDRPLNGGILVWHVDERRLRAGMPENAVNVGPQRRAVDLEEADGAQDIGFPSGPFGPRAELGTPFDFFFEGNPATVVTEGGREIRLYENRFGPDTYPSSTTNGGGPSFIVLEDFSEAAPEMSFTYRIEGQDGLAPAELENAEAVAETIHSQELTFEVGSAVTRFDEQPFVFSAPGSAAVSLTTADVYPSITMPVLTGGQLVSLAESDEQSLVLQAISAMDATGGPDWSVEVADSGLGMHPVSPLVRTASGGYYGLLGGSGGTVLMEASSEGAELKSVDTVGPLVDVVAAAQEANGDVLVVGREGAGFLGEGRRWGFSLPSNVQIGRSTFGRDDGGLVGAVPVIDPGVLLLLRPDGDVQTIDVAALAVQGSAEPSGTLSAYPVLIDLDRDARLDVLIAYGARLYAFTQTGAVVRDFPRRLPAPVVSQPLVARFEGDEEWTVLTAASDGYVYAHGPSGLRQGFPLEVGDAADATPLLADERLYAVSRSGTVKAWEVPAVAEIWWGELFGDPDNSSFVRLETTPPSAGEGDALVDASETYNWPNPIEAGTTHLRIRTSQDARVRVTILDAGGWLVEQLDLGQVAAGIPTEIEWTTDAESGLYFARFTASTDGGDEDTVVIKMAVIR